MNIIDCSYSSPESVSLILLFNTTTSVMHYFISQHHRAKILHTSFNLSILKILHIPTSTWKNENTNEEIQILHKIKINGAQPYNNLRGH